MSRTPRRASKQIDYAAFGDGEDEDALDLSAEDAEDDDVRPKKREKKDPVKKKDDRKNRMSVVIDDNDDDVVLVEDRDADDFDLGRRILSNIAQKIPEIIKPKKKNVIDDDEVINLEEDDPKPVVTFRNLPKIGGQTVGQSPPPPQELSPRAPVVEKQPTKRERTPPKKRVIDSDSDNDFSGEADGEYDDDFGFEEERSRSKKRKAEPKEKKAPTKRAKRNKDDDVSVSESISTRHEEVPKPKPVSVVIEPVKEIIPERKPQSAPVKEVVIKEVNSSPVTSKKKEQSIDSDEEEERSVSTSNQPAIETKRDKRALITSAANTQYGGNKTIEAAANGHTSSAKKKNESEEEVTSGPSTPIKPKPVMPASNTVVQSKPIVTNSSPKKPGLSKANGEQSSSINLSSPVRRRVGLSRTQRVPSLHGDK